MLLKLLEEPKTNRQIYKETLGYEFLPKHTNAIFEQWQSNKPNFKVLDLKTKKEARKGSFYISYDNYNEDKVQFRMEKE
jgi:hypothetical protein